jgi:hypothetical protein
MQSQSTIEDIDLPAALAKVLAQLDNLSQEFRVHEYSNDAAKRMASHGICRRLSLLEYSSQRIFEAISPTEQSPFFSSGQVEATAMYQVFIFNLYGAIDNLAWVWVLETNVRQASGDALDRKAIGFHPRKNYRTVRKSLPNQIDCWLTKAAPWFGYLSGSRNALAHRTPPYVVPSVLNTNWGPCITYNDPNDTTIVDPENIRIVRLHGQIVCDLMTLHDLAEKILAALADMQQGTALDP